MCFGSAEAQNQATYHTVQAGEGFFGIAKQYGVTVEELKSENPDVASRGLKVGDVLLIPAKKEEAPKEGKWHTVVAGDTWYSLSKAYEVAVLELQKANPELGNILAIGAEVKIPEGLTADATWPKDSIHSTWLFHWVRPGETLYSLRRTYQTTLDTLVVLNPEVKNGLKVGMRLQIPNQGAPSAAVRELPKPKQKEVRIAVAKDSTEDENPYLLYQLQPGDDVAGIAKVHRLTQKEVLRLNPELLEGIEPGRFIVLPRQIGVEDSGSAVEQVLNQHFPEVNKPKANIRVAVLLPFFLNEQDSLQILGDYAGGIGKKSEVGVEFFQGVKIAADSLAKAGYGIELNVYETRGDSKVVDQLLAKGVFEGMDLILGPLYSGPAEHLAEALGNKEIPIVSPLSAQLNLTSRKNLVAGVPTYEDEVRVLADALRNRYKKGERIVICLPAGEKELARANQLAKALEANQMKAQMLQASSSMLAKGRLQEALAGKGRRWVLVTSQDKAFLSDLATKLYSFRDTSLRMVGTSRIWDVTTLEIQYLNKLHLLATEVFYVDYSSAAANRFVNEYRNTWEAEPGRFGFMGYDAALAFMLAVLNDQLKAGFVHKGLSTEFNLRQVENGGLRNGSFYLLELRNYVRKSVSP